MHPAERVAFAPPGSLAEAEAFTRELAGSHYENFSVLSLLLPKHLRQDFSNIYAFCRAADDLGDEVHDESRSLGLLARFKDDTHACYAGQCRSMIFVALADTIRRHDIPATPFLDLIDAFEQDQRVKRYETYAELLEYCRRSANPVGRLVLYLCGYRDEQRQQLSDYTCTALQIANFLQDVRRDAADLGRIYIPRDTLRRFDVDEQQFFDARFDENFRQMMKFEVDRTQELFDRGDALLPLLDPSVRSHIALFGRGGKAVLEAIRTQGYDTLSRRPTLSGWQKGRLMLSVVVAQLGRLKGVGA
jgi:squalene synthase HpnC